MKRSILLITLALLSISLSAKTVQVYGIHYSLDEKEAPKTEPAVELVPITLEEVRTVLAELSRDGKTQEVKNLLKKHGATKLSEINPDEWEALLEEAAEIRHGS